MLICRHVSAKKSAIFVFSGYTSNPKKYTKFGLMQDPLIMDIQKRWVLRQRVTTGERVLGQTSLWGQSECSTKGNF